MDAKMALKIHKKNHI